MSEQAIGGASFVRVDVPAVAADGEQLPAPSEDEDELNAGDAWDGVG